MTKYKLGNIAGLTLGARPPAIAGSVVLFILLIGVAVWFLRLPIGDAVVGSLVAVIIHWFSVLAHQLGHAWAAHRTGHPMTGVLLGSLGLLGASLYPHDEPSLPAEVHIRRALGGPAGSLLASLLAALIALALRSSGGLPWWLAVFTFLDNFIVFALGSFLPLGFTDGSTLLKWWGKR